MTVTRRTTRRAGLPPQVQSFGAYVLGLTVIVLMILGCVLSSHTLMGAAVIVAVPLFALLAFMFLHRFDRSDR